MLGMCLAALFSSTANDRALGATAHTSLPTPLTGITIAGGGDSASIAGRIANAYALHAKVVRTEVSWSLFEPEGPNAIDQLTLSSLDTLVSDAAARGIRVILLV